MYSFVLGLPSSTVAYISNSILLFLHKDLTSEWVASSVAPGTGWA